MTDCSTVGTRLIIDFLGGQLFCLHDRRVITLRNVDCLYIEHWPTDQHQNLVLLQIGQPIFQILT